MTGAFLQTWTSTKEGIDLTRSSASENDDEFDSEVSESDDEPDYEVRENRVDEYCSVSLAGRLYYLCGPSWDGWRVLSPSHDSILLIGL